MTPEELEAAVLEGITRDRVARGLPKRIADPVILARVAAMVVGAPERAPRSEPGPQLRPRRRRVPIVPAPSGGSDG